MKKDKKKKKTIPAQDANCAVLAESPTQDANCTKLAESEAKDVSAEKKKKKNQKQKHKRKVLFEVAPALASFLLYRGVSFTAKKKDDRIVFRVPEKHKDVLDIQIRHMERISKS